jgi:hypothetical protein
MAFLTRLLTRSGGADPSVGWPPFCFAMAGTSARRC